MQNGIKVESDDSNMKKVGGKSVVVIDGGNIGFDDIIAVARDGVEVRISKDKSFV
ncbi:MAG: hypothetical protein HGA29_07795, partial [Syntrophaceae bacterium]|nr:hypothetical protein [Syntrophaceae bacterium]